MNQIKFNLKRHIFNQIIGKLKMPDSKQNKEYSDNYFNFIWHVANFLEGMYNANKMKRDSLPHNMTKSDKPLIIYFEEA